MCARAFSSHVIFTFYHCMQRLGESVKSSTFLNRCEVKYLGQFLSFHSDIFHQHEPTITYDSKIKPHTSHTRARPNI